MEKEISPSNFKQRLTSLPVKTKKKHKNFIHEQILPQISAADIQYIWYKMEMYWDFLNYSLLEHLVNRFGDNALKTSMLEYKESLRKFRCKTRLCDFVRHFKEVNKCLGGEELTSLLEVKFEKNWEGCTLEDLENWKESITQTLLLPSFVLILKDTDSGCVSVTWAIPAIFAASVMEDMETMDMREFCVEILSLRIDGKECVSTQSPDIGGHPSLEEPQTSATKGSKTAPPQGADQWPTLALSRPGMTRPVQTALRKGATGLVVIITNDYSSTPRIPGSEDLPELKGTLHDGHMLSSAFTGLGFAVCWQRNVSGHAMVAIITELKNLKFSDMKGYGSIIFVFAGHGCEGDYLWMQDRTKIQISNVVDPLLPKNAQQIASIKKAFLIDACRGKQTTETVVVPRSSSPPDTRGGSLMDVMKVCGDGNFLLAYSTLPMHKAYENPGSGGVWLSTVARLLSERRYLFSLECLLTEVNEEMMGKMQGQGSSSQQPEKLSRLNGHINLDPRYAYTLLLSRYARSCGIEEHYTDTPFFVEEYNHTYYTSQVAVRGSNGSTTWNGTECHISPEIAREEVAKMAYQSLTGQSVGPTPLTPTSAPARAPIRAPERVPNPQDPPKRNNRTALNEYCQKKGVSQRDEFIEDHSTGQPKFKCTITCLLEGSKIVQDSGQYYPRKDDAKEVAASKILAKIKEREKSRTQGAAGVAAGRGGVVKGTAVSPPNTIWKSQLKEHYDKQGKAGMELKYKTSEVAGGGFVASIFISELSKEVRGERGNNKKEAEQNAAKKAVQQLQQRKLFCV